MVAAIMEAERGFRRLRGHKGLPLHREALGRTAERTTRVDQQREAA